MFDFGNWLRATRIERGESQLNFADFLKIGIATERNYEYGNYTPKLSWFLEMIDALGYEMYVTKKEEQK